MVNFKEIDLVLRVYTYVCCIDYYFILFFYMYSDSFDTSSGFIKMKPVPLPYLYINIYIEITFDITDNLQNLFSLNSLIIQH